MSLWVDKYRPQSLNDLQLSPKITSRLMSLAQSHELPHILITGPIGSGKSTRIRAFLKELYNTPIMKVKLEEKVFQTASGRKLQFPVYTSIFHMEVSPSEVGIYDRVVIQEILKEFSQSPPIEKSLCSFKVAVILEAEKLTKDAQHALRRTMEKYSSNVRLVLVATSPSRLIAPIKSRCLHIRLGTAKKLESVNILKTVALKEGFKPSDAQIEAIVDDSFGNIRNALLKLEVLSKTGSYSFPEWHSVVSEMVDIAFEEQSPSSLLRIRNKLYSLLTLTIPPQAILHVHLFSLYLGLVHYLGAFEKYHREIAPDLIAGRLSCYFFLCKHSTPYIYD